MYVDKIKLSCRPYTAPHYQHSQQYGGEGNGSKSSPNPLPHSRKAKPIYTQLGNYHQGPVGAEHSSGLHHRLGVSTTPALPTYRAEVSSGRDRGTDIRGPENDSQASGITDTEGTGKQGIHIPAILCPNKGWRHEAYYKPKGPQHLRGDSPLQDGRYPHAEGYSKIRRLDDKSRPERCLLYDTDGIAPQTPTEISVAGANLPVQLPTIRAVVSTMGLYHDHTASIVATLRSLGLRLIIYIDDILIMAPSPIVAREHTAGLIFLLENLGFIINYPKSLLTPTQEIQFLGFVISSNTMEIRLPGEKIKQIRQDTRKLLGTPIPQALALSRLLGKLNHAAQAIPPAPLFYRNLQLCLRRSLEGTAGGRDYSTQAYLTPAASQELEWWREHLTRWNGQCLLITTPDVMIQTDASTTGWGATCKGVRTGGPWSKTERQMHINCLELLAATLAIKSYFKGKENLHIHLMMDNTTALTYINKYGGTVSPELNRLTKELWLWCLERNITIQASHLPGTLNCTADEESRVMRDRSDWMLCPKVFNKINLRTGPLQVDLFASRLTHQLREYVSWRPDPEAVATDAFTLDWTRFKGYANPPWNLIG